jgi:prepilin-type N-terminal cleavage/methylation domain-containing protein
MIRLRRTRRHRSEQGFSVLELLLVIAIGGTVMGIALFSTKYARAAFQANGAMETLKSRMLAAREMAIARQRDIAIAFIGTDTVRFMMINPDATTTQVDELTMEGKVIFTTFNGQGAPADQTWCTDGANAFRVLNGQGTLRFNSDGALVDAVTRNIVSGCLYVGKANDPETARAISLFGATGRARTYKFMSAAWVH